ncbi:unnamed protein product [Phytomonas sp. EM1]|nr:unnamed protein product [Phytomonas sp. EM1]|eukprot:CCW59744.1 unnamed protein product [Phytomonas sp. isolate EM1]
MTDKSVYGGLFQDPPYISTDPDPAKTDPYDKQDCIPSRYLGKSMLAGPSRDYFSDKFLTLASTEQNADVIAANAKRLRTQPAGPSPKNIADTEFRYTSPAKQSTGPGSYYGCFQSKPYEYLTEPWEEGGKKSKREKKSAAKAAAAAAALAEEYKHLPNIKTNPPKKGTYGYPGLLLSREIFNESLEEGGKGFAAKGAPHKAKVEPPAIGPVFRVPGVSHAFLDELPNTGVSAIYADYHPPATPRSRRSIHKRAAADVKTLIQKPFNWSAYKASNGGCINSFPNVWIDPATQVSGKPSKHRKAREEAEKTEVQRMKEAPKWTPNSFGKTSIISSCLRRFY